MAEIINLRQARKIRQRRAAEAEAAENRIRFGRTKGERQATDTDEAVATRRLDGHRIEPDKEA